MGDRELFSAALFYERNTLEITYTLTHDELMRRFAPPMPMRERLPLLLMIPLPLLAYAAVAYVRGFWEAIDLYVIAGFYGFACLLTGTIWVLKLHIKRTSISTTCLLGISEFEFFEKTSDNSEHHHSWIHLGNIADVGDYFMFTSTKGQHVAVIPKSAFDDENHAQTFLMQSRRYWEAAKQKQQEEAPAPRPKG